MQVDDYDLSSLKVIMSGAAPLGGDVQVACGQRLNCFVKQVLLFHVFCLSNEISTKNLRK